MNVRETVERQHGSVVVIKKPSLRQRIGRWLSGDPNMKHILINASASNTLESEIIEKKHAAEEIDGGMRFRIIPAENGKIIGYFPQRDDPVARRISSSNGEQYYVVKEGDNLMGALASCLALDRIK